MAKLIKKYLICMCMDINDSTIFGILRLVLGLLILSISTSCMSLITYPAAAMHRVARANKENCRVDNATSISNG